MDNTTNNNTSVSIDDLIPIEDEDIGSAIQAIVCFCLDTSYSMQGQKIRVLNDVVNNFIQKNKNDICNSNMLNLSMVTFGGSESKVVQDFTNIKNVEEQDFKANGGTHMSKGIETAIKLINSEKQRLSGRGVSTYKPILIVMSDGRPDEPIDEVALELKALAKKKKINTYCIAYNSDNDSKQDKEEAFAALQKLTNKKVETANEFNIDELFLKLSRSMSNLSRSFAGDTEDIL